MALQIAAAALILAYLIGRPTPLKKENPTGPCQTKYCYGEMWIDKPMNTELKDQSLGVGLRRPETLPGFKAVEKKLAEDFFKDALESPGVRLVARNVASNPGF
jgi:hypothetical protein